jgi:hypothetical protein
MQVRKRVAKLMLQLWYLTVIFQKMEHLLYGCMLGTCIRAAGLTAGKQQQAAKGSYVTDACCLSLQLPGYRCSRF